eukprot:3311147-Rhodomonas_salina.1
MGSLWTPIAIVFDSRNSIANFNSESPSEVRIRHTMSGTDVRCATARSTSNALHTKCPKAWSGVSACPLPQDSQHCEFSSAPVELSSAMSDVLAQVGFGDALPAEEKKTKDLGNLVVSRKELDSRIKFLRHTMDSLRDQL